jgi:hypothetical protein
MAVDPIARLMFGNQFIEVADERRRQRIAPIERRYRFG